MNKIDEIKERLAKIIPGDWELISSERPSIITRDPEAIKEGWNFIRLHGEQEPVVEIMSFDNTRWSEANAKFMANAPQDIAFLLEQIEQLMNKDKEKTKSNSEEKPRMCGCGFIHKAGERCGTF